MSAETTDGTVKSSRRFIQDSLVALRSLLRMEVAFVSRIADGRRWFEFLDDDPAFSPLRVGDSDPLEETYCARVLDGRLPGLVRDATALPELRELPGTTDLPVGAHLSVPIRDLNGRPMGTLCCFSRQPDQGLQDRDLSTLTVFATLISDHLAFLMDHDVRARQLQMRLDEVRIDGGPRMALQPIVDSVTGRPFGWEALARFPEVAGLPGWTPDRWFHEAAAVGRGDELEALAVRQALTRLRLLPDDASLFVNVSAQALCRSSLIVDLFSAADASRLVVELTEHEAVEAYDELELVLTRLRAVGARIAADDAGSGYAGLAHILRIEPEVLKLDRSLVTGISEDLGRQAMCESMVAFTRRTGAVLIAEGVETEAELETLRALRVPLVQGFLLGRPEMPHEEQLTPRAS